MLRSACLIFILVLVSTAWAQEPAAATPSHDAAVKALPEPELAPSMPPDAAADELNLGWTLARTMVVLAMVVGLAWLTLNVGLRRLMGIRSVVGTSVVTVLERVTLDQKRALFVVEAAGEVLLIGGGEGALSVLAKLDRAEVEKMKPPRSSSSVQMSPFLKKLLGRTDKMPPPEA